MILPAVLTVIMKVNNFNLISLSAIGIFNFLNILSYPLKLRE